MGQLENTVSMRYMIISIDMLFNSVLYCQKFKNGNRYDDGVNRSQRGNNRWAID